MVSLDLLSGDYKRTSGIKSAAHGLGFISMRYHNGFLYAGGTKNSSSDIIDDNLNRYPIIVKVDYQLSGIVWAYQRILAEGGE